MRDLREQRAELDGHFTSTIWPGLQPFDVVLTIAEPPHAPSFSRVLESIERQHRRLFVRRLTWFVVAAGLTLLLAAPARLS